MSYFDTFEITTMRKIHLYLQIDDRIPYHIAHMSLFCIIFFLIHIFRVSYLCSKDPPVAQNSLEMIENEALTFLFKFQNCIFSIKKYNIL